MEVVTLDSSKQAPDAGGRVCTVLQLLYGLASIEARRFDQGTSRSVSEWIMISAGPSFATKPRKATNPTGTA